MLDGNLKHFAHEWIRKVFSDNEIRIVTILDISNALNRLKKRWLHSCARNCSWVTMLSLVAANLFQFALLAHLLLLLRRLCIRGYGSIYYKFLIRIRTSRKNRIRIRIWPSRKKRLLPIFFLDIIVLLFTKYYMKSSI